MTKKFHRKQHTQYIYKQLVKATISTYISISAVHRHIPISHSCAYKELAATNS